MTNREWLNQMSDEEFADWLCRQMFEDYEKVHGMLNATRYHTVRNFLKMEHREESNDDSV